MKYAYLDKGAILHLSLIHILSTHNQATDAHSALFTEAAAESKEYTDTQKTCLLYTSC